MISHGAPQMRDLSERCAVTDEEVINGWSVDRWTLDYDDVTYVADLYRATIVPDTISDRMKSLVLSNGVSVEDLLTDTASSRDQITRSDATELTAAASFLAADGWPEETLSMPNVPKASRKKSESGIDVMAVTLAEDESPMQLTEGDKLFIGSVKHSVQPNARGARYALAKSLQSDLVPSKLGRQLTVLHSKVTDKGTSPAQAERLYLFLNHINDPQYVRIHGAIAVDLEAEAALVDDLKKPPRARISGRAGIKANSLS